MTPKQARRKINDIYIAAKKEKDTAKQGLLLEQVVALRKFVPMPTPLCFWREPEDTNK